MCVPCMCVVPQEYDQFCVTDVNSKIELVPKETQCFDFAFLPLAEHMWQTLEVGTGGSTLSACCAYIQMVYVCDAKGLMRTVCMYMQ